jgi:hypothetical protein
LKSVSTTNQKPKSIKWKAWNCCQKLESCLYNKPKTKLSIKSKLETIAVSLTLLQKAWHLSLQQPETNQSNQSFNFCFNNTTRNMKSIKSKLTIVGKKIQASISVSTTQLLEIWNQSNQSLKLLPKNWRFNFCSTTQLETWNQSNQKLTIVTKKNSSFNFCFNNTTKNIKSIKSKLEIVVKNSSFNCCFNNKYN